MYLFSFKVEFMIINNILVFEVIKFYKKLYLILFK